MNTLKARQITAHVVRYCGKLKGLTSCAMCLIYACLSRAELVKTYLFACQPVDWIDELEFLTCPQGFLKDYFVAIW
jgi:hypothetical protein